MVRLVSAFTTGGRLGVNGESKYLDFPTRMLDKGMTLRKFSCEANFF